MRALRLAVLAPIALLIACGPRDERDPGGISAGEAQELNDAAVMLDANAIDANAVATTTR